MAIIGNEAILQVICCPYHYDSGLRDVNNNDMNIFECSECGRSFHFRDGVLVLMPDIEDNMESLLATKEQEVRDSQVDRYSLWFGEYTNQLEYEAITDSLCLDSNDILVDLGCGIGRYTLKFAQQVSTVIAVDHSLQSLLYLKKQMEKMNVSNIILVQADISHLPLKSSICTKAVSSQVLTFLPGNAMRERSAHDAHRVLTSKGVAVFTVFNYHIYRVIKRLLGVQGVFSREGLHHELGFYYYNFGRNELAGLLSRNGFIIDSARGICNFPREKVMHMQRKIIKKLVHRIDRIVEFTPLSYMMGDLLIAIAQKS